MGIPLDTLIPGNLITPTPGVTKVLVQDEEAASEVGYSLWPESGSSSGSALEQVTGPLADTTLEVNKQYIVDASDLTGHVTYSLPSCAIGDRIQIVLVTGNPDFEVSISGNIHGYSGLWSKLFTREERVEFTALYANAWYLTHDGRIPCYGKLRYEDFISSAAGNTETVIPFTQEVLNTQQGDPLVIRRRNVYSIDLTSSLGSLSSGDRLQTRLYVHDGTSKMIRRSPWAVTPSGLTEMTTQLNYSSVFPYGAVLTPKMFQSNASSRPFLRDTADVASEFTIQEMFVTKSPQQLQTDSWALPSPGPCSMCLSAPGTVDVTVNWFEFEGPASDTYVETLSYHAPGSNSNRCQWGVRYEEPFNIIEVSIWRSSPGGILNLVIDAGSGNYYATTFPEGTTCLSGTHTVYSTDAYQNPASHAIVTF